MPIGTGVFMLVTLPGTNGSGCIVLNANYIKRMSTAVWPALPAADLCHPQFVTNLPELSGDSSRRNEHYNRIDSTDFIIRNTFLSGRRREHSHSGVAAHCHGSPQLDHQCRLWVYNPVIDDGTVKVCESLLQMLWYHGFLLVGRCSPASRLTCRPGFGQAAHKRARFFHPP